MQNTTEYNTDFCVIGGGLAGVCAAIAAARQGDNVQISLSPVFYHTLGV